MIKKHQEILFNLSNVELGIKKLDEFFVMKATSQRTGTYFLANKDLLKMIHSVRKTIVRISIDSADDPSIRVYTRINEDLDLVKLHLLFMTLCNRVNEVSEKKIMTKRFS